MRARRAGALIVSLAALGLCLRPAIGEQIPSDVREFFKHPGDVHIYYSATYVPEAVRAAFSAAAGDGPFDFADPGQEWQATCTSQGPRRRLHSVAVSNGFCMLSYELGGRGLSDYVVVFRLVADRAEVAWHAATDYVVREPSDVLRGVKRGAVNDDAGYYF